MQPNLFRTIITVNLSDFPQQPTIRLFFVRIGFELNPLEPVGN